MRRSRMNVIALVALALMSAAADAQLHRTGTQSRRPIRFAFGGGVSVPTSDYGDAFKNGFNGQGSVIIDIAGFPLNLRADLNYNRFEFKEPEFGVPGNPLDGSSQILGGLANITIPISLGPITPYISAGLGAFNIRSTIETGSSETTDSETKFGINGGAGIAFRLFGAGGFIEARMNNVYTDEGVANFRDVRFIPVTFGVVF